MKKILFALTFFIAISLFSDVSANAAQGGFRVDTATHINLVERDRFAVNLELNKLIFENEPLSKGYEDIWLEVLKGGNTVKKVTYMRGEGDGAKIDLAGLADGTYVLRIGYVFYRTIGEEEEDEYGEDEYVETDNGIYAFPNYASYGFDIVVKGGKAGFKCTEKYPENLKFIASERTDIYALDFYKNKSELDYFKKTGILKLANSIVAGITDDYAKVKAIHDWVANNIWYDWDLFAYMEGFGEEPGTSYISPADVLKYKRTVCDGYARLTTALLQAVGFPAKYVSGRAFVWGKWAGHAWTEVYVDNRWLFFDATWDSQNSYGDGEFSEQRACSDEWFDVPLGIYSGSHEIGFSAVSANNLYGDDDAWDGTLVFVDANNFNKVLKEVKNFPLNGVVNSTYGFDIKDLYDGNNKPLKLGKMKVDSTNFVIPVDVCHGKAPTQVRYNVVDPQGYIIDYEDSFYINFDYNYGEGDYYTNYYGYIQREMPPYLAVPADELLKKPVDPVLKGYTFIGWYNKDTGKKWNFTTDKFTEKNNGMVLQTRWKKATKSYKVTFNSNKGTSLKSLIIATDSTVSKPNDPTRSGYQFAGWYKDSKFTKKWNFTSNKVTANTTLYAKWDKIYTITCNANGGTGVFDVLVEANTVATKPIETVRSGYTFTGWYKDAECTTAWNFKTDKVTANTTLYAGWKPN